MSSPGNDDPGEDDFLDITDLVRRCASECLSFSQPFTPIAAPAPLDRSRGSGADDGDAGEGTRGDAVADGALMEGLHIKGTSVDGSGRPDDDADDDGRLQTVAPKLAPLDLQDAMTALELGDKRMDCCEIPLAQESAATSQHQQQVDGQEDSSARPEQTLDEVTFPPRVAPTSLSDGTPPPASLSNDDTSRASSFNPSLPANALLLPTSPCPSLLPHWDGLRLSSLPSLLMLQLTALEAYIGTNNGGSNAAETLYCMLWFHDGVLSDMADRLGVGAAADVCKDVSAGAKNVEENGFISHNGVKSNEQQRRAGENGPEDDDELNVARWTLFASSLGVVRIAEAVRWAVVNADFYEEEDFGVALHGGRCRDEDGEKKSGEEEEGVPGDGRSGDGASGDTESPSSDQPASVNDIGTKKGGSSMRFCPALPGSQYVEVVWDTALSRLRRYQSSCAENAKDVDTDELNSTIDALEHILQLQQSFFQAVKILSNLNDETVRDFSTIAVKRSRETVNLFEKLQTHPAIAELSRGGLVGLDGQLRTISDRPKLNHLLSASFDPFVNRRLLGNAPVRKAVFRQPSDVIKSLSRLAAELEWGVCDPILHGNTFGRVTRMFEKNSLRGSGGVVPVQTPNPDGSSAQGLETERKFGVNILSRSLMVLNLYFDDKLLGQYDFPQMIGQHMRQQCAVPELLLTSTDWLTRMAKPMYDTLKALCLNRHRERGFTESILLPAFRNLQYEAASVDEKFRIEHGLDAKTTPAYATNYVIVNTIRLMERHVGLGIELGLYPNWYDLSTALWYRDFLLSALINVKGSIERERLQRQEMNMRIKTEQEEERRAKAQLQQQSRKKSKAKKGKAKSKRPISPSPEHIAESKVNVKNTAEDFEDRLDYTSLLLHRNLCRGLVRIIAALRQAELISDPPASFTMFTTHQTRFEKRFEAFSSLPQPPTLSYDDYVRGSDFSAVQSKDLQASATECFRSGKGIVDWLLDVVVPDSCDGSTINETEKRKDDDLYISVRREEIMAIAKVCVTNSLSLHKLSMFDSKQNASKPKVTLEFKAHKLYCTLSIK